MPRERLSMRSIREIIRLSLQLGLSANTISRSVDVSRGKVQETLRRVKEEQLPWPIPDGLNDEALEALLFGSKKEVPVQHKDLDWDKVAAELRRKGVTRKLLWQEYKERNLTELSYPQFCKRFRRWQKHCDPVMQQHHNAGEKLFIDFAGLAPTITDRETGEVIETPVFVATFGASNYTYAEACPGQDLESWTGAHKRAFKFFGGTPKFLVPDNLKSAVTRRFKHDVLLNRTYYRLAEFYSCGILPARVKKPKDKAKVEKGVQDIEQRVLAPLRNRTFFSLHELNKEIFSLLEKHNLEPFQKMSGSRKSWFDKVDKPALNELPSEDFEFEHWSTGVPVPKNYHVTVDGHRYSVPYQHIGSSVDIRHTNSTIEVFLESTRIASHIRSWAENQSTTLASHMPPKHAAYHGISAESFLQQAEKVGPKTTQVIQYLLDSKPYPQLSFDQCFGLLKTLKKKYGPEQLEQACDYALCLQTPRYRFIKLLLDRGLDTLPKQLPLPSTNFDHENIRGPEYYK